MIISSSVPRWRLPHGVQGEQINPLILLSFTVPDSYSSMLVLQQLARTLASTQALRRND